MAGWRNALVGVGAALVTSGVGVAVNLATDWRTNLVAWGAVVALSVVAGLVATWAAPPARRAGRASGAGAGPEREPAVDQAVVGGDRITHNTISGTVHGSVVQAHTVHGAVHQHEPPPGRNRRS